MQCTAHPFVVPKAILVGIICVLFCSLVSGVELVTVPSTLTAGKTYSITYSPADDTPTTWTLRKGSPDNLDTVGVLGTSTGGTFEWTVPSSLPDGDDYAFEIQQDGSFPNFSGLVTIQGGNADASSSSMTAASSPKPSSAPAQISSSASSTTSTDSSSPQSQKETSTPSSERQGSSTQIQSNPSASIVTSTYSSNLHSQTATSKPSSEQQGLPTQTPNTSTPYSPSATTVQNNSQGLSKGGKVGIGVGAAVGGLVLALGAFFLGASVWRKSSAKQEDHESAGTWGKPEIDGRELNATDQSLELDGQESRLQAHSSAVEMSSQEQPRTKSSVAQPLPVSSPPAELGNNAPRTELDTQPSQLPSLQELFTSNDPPASRQPPDVPDQGGVGQPELFSDPRLTANPWA